MNDRAKPVSRPRRRFLRLSVRGLIIVVLVIGVGLARLVVQCPNQVPSRRCDRTGRVALRDMSKLYRGHFPRVTRAEKWRNWAANLIGIEYSTTSRTFEILYPHQRRWADSSGGSREPRRALA